MSDPILTIHSPAEATALNGPRQGRVANQRCALSRGGHVWVATYGDGSKEVFSETPVHPRNLPEIAKLLAHPSSTSKPIKPTQK